MEDEDWSEVKSSLGYGLVSGSIVFLIELFILISFDVPQSWKGFCIFLSLIIAIAAASAVFWLMYSDFIARKNATQSFLHFAQTEKDRVVSANLILSKSAIASGNKSEALRCGRLYYASMRDDNCLTLYDEQALNNDINAM